MDHIISISLLFSSRFRHVFEGEVKSMRGKLKVTGFHNWIQFNTLNENKDLSGVKTLNEHLDVS